MKYIVNLQNNETKAFFRKTVEAENMDQAMSKALEICDAPHCTIVTDVYEDVYIDPEKPSCFDKEYKELREILSALCGYPVIFYNN